MSALRSQVYKVRCDDNVIRASKEVPLGEFDDRQLQSVYLRFTRELYILSKLKHERVVAIYGAAASESRLALIMEYIPRGSLRRVMDSHWEWRKFTADDRRILLQDIAEGVQYLHARSVSLQLSCIGGLRHINLIVFA